MRCKKSLQSGVTESGLHQQLQKQCTRNMAVASHFGYGNTMTMRVLAADSQPLSRGFESTLWPRSSCLFGPWPAPPCCRTTSRANPAPTVPSPTPQSPLPRQLTSSARHTTKRRQAARAALSAGLAAGGWSLGSGRGRGGHPRCAATSSTRGGCRMSSLCLAAALPATRRWTWTLQGA